MSDLVLETKLYNLSTRGNAGSILNVDPNFKSKIEYDIRNMIVVDENVQYVQFSIPDAVIPVSFYPINNTNCNLTVIENGITTTYAFPYGNYTANYFITQFSALLGARWTLSLNNYNSVFVVTNSTYAFSFVDATSTIDSIMGFSSNLSSTVVAPYTLTMSRCCNFLPLPRICIRCPELANTSMVGQNATSDVLITIPNNSKPNGQIYYQNQSQAKLLFRHNELSRFIVSFTDDDGNLLNFNGISSFFTFQFDIYRNYIPKPPRFSNIIDMVNSQVAYQDFQNRMIQEEEDYNDS